MCSNQILNWKILSVDNLYIGLMLWFSSYAAEYFQQE